MLASGRLSASTVPACRRSINRPASHRHPCPAAPAVLVSPSPTPIPQRNATGRRLDSTSSNLTPRPNPHRARGTDGAPTSRDFVPRRFSDAGHPSAYQGRHRRRPKTCTKPDPLRRGRRATRSRFFRRSAQGRSAGGVSAAHGLDPPPRCDPCRVLHTHRSGATASRDARTYLLVSAAATAVAALYPPRMSA